MRGGGVVSRLQHSLLTLVSQSLRVTCVQPISRLQQRPCYQAYQLAWYQQPSVCILICILYSCIMIECRMEIDVSRHVFQCFSSEFQYVLLLTNHTDMDIRKLLKRTRSPSHQNEDSATRRQKISTDDNKAAPMFDDIDEEAVDVDYLQQMTVS